MAKYIYIVERNSFFNENGVDYRGGAFNTDIRVFAKKSSALEFIVIQKSEIENSGEDRFVRYEYNKEEINFPNITELIVYSQETYNKYGWRVSYTYRKQLIE